MGHGLLVANLDARNLLEWQRVLEIVDNIPVKRYGAVASRCKQKSALRESQNHVQPTRLSHIQGPSGFHIRQKTVVYASRPPVQSARNAVVNLHHVSSSVESSGSDGDTKKGFHQRRFTATKRLEELREEGLAVHIREPTSEDELNAVAVLRALSFYAYRPERAFAGKLHQKMKAGEEFERLLELRKNSRNPEQQEACLAAFCRWDTVPSAPEELRVTSSGGEDLVLVGSLDVCASTGVEGQVLRGRSDNAAYLVNVCVSEAARRRRVGRSLLEEARRRAHAWGVDALYVHTMAVNEVAQEFYRKHGFVLEQEESSNEAHYRGHCLDGIEGRGRTVLLRDERFALPNV